MGSSNSMIVFNCRDQGSTTVKTKDQQILVKYKEKKCRNPGSTTVKTKDQQIIVKYKDKK